MTWTLALACAAATSWVAAWWVLRNAAGVGLVQSPNHRSAHAVPTPSGGGVGIALAGSLTGAILLAGGGWHYGWSSLLLSIVVAVIGLRTDIQELPASARLLSQILVCAGLLWAAGGLPAVQVFSGLSVDGVPLILALLVFGTWWINLFNFMDGIDGIAGVQAVFMLVAGAGLAALNVPGATATPAWEWMLCVAAAAGGFLCLNWPPARIFMGDVGSTYLAFMIFSYALASVNAGWMGYSTWLILAGVFVADTTVTLLVRMMRGERWYEAHSSHAYQRLARALQSHRSVTLLVLALDIFWLLPLAWLTLAWPGGAWLVLLVAYLPLLLGAVRLRREPA